MENQLYIIIIHRMTIPMMLDHEQVKEKHEQMKLKIFVHFVFFFFLVESTDCPSAPATTTTAAAAAQDDIPVIELDDD